MRFAFFSTEESILEYSRYRFFSLSLKGWRLVFLYKLSFLRNEHKRESVSQGERAKPYFLLEEQKVVLSLTAAITTFDSSSRASSGLDKLRIRDQSLLEMMSMNVSFEKTRLNSWFDME